jgi:beta-phosphoglucomutase
MAIYGDEQRTPRHGRLADRKNRDYVDLIAAIGPRDALPGAREALADCRAAGILTALASASRNARQLVERLGFHGCLDVIADPASASAGKPHPGIFLEAARLLKLAPSNCVGVEDSLAGLQAIKAAAMFAVGIGRSATLCKAGADLVVPSMNEFSSAFLDVFCADI